MIVPFERHASGTLIMIDGTPRQRRQAGERARQVNIANDGASLAERRSGAFNRTPCFRLCAVPQLGAAEPDARRRAEAAQRLRLVKALDGG